MESNDRRLLDWVVLSVIAVVGWVCLTYWPRIRNEFFVLLGSRNESGGWYGFHSGAGGAFWMSAIPATLLLYWHHTCHVGMCLRLGKYPAADGMFKLCHRHHPDLGGVKPTHALICQLHRERSCGTC